MNTDKNGNISYSVKNSSEKEKIQPNKEERIKYIMSYKPVVRP